MSEAADDPRGRGPERERRHLDVVTDHSPRAVLSYMVGVFVAVNAVRDAFLLVDGPDCIYTKTQYLQGNQDYLASLVSVSGYHRISHTGLRCASNVALGRHDEIRAALEWIGRHDEVGCVLTAPMPAASVVGTDYEMLCADAAGATGTETIPVAGKSLTTDWLGGYAETLHALARHIELPDVPRREGSVAVVGYLFDRNEEDNLGNVRELERLMSALGLELSSVWLGGQRFDELRRVSEAETIVSLPYGRRAARVLARRTGARLLDLELPFGIDATERFLREIAGDAGRDRVERFVEAELAHIVPKLEWVVPFLFQGRTFGYAGDPFLLSGLSEILRLFGATLDFAVVTNFRHHLHGLDLEGRCRHLLVEERLDGLARWSSRHLEETPLDCVVTNNTCIEMFDPSRHAVVELGFPTYGVHALYDRPYLGFRGFLAFVDTLANQIRTFESRKG